jgi:GT2 family glycosyltransferase/SAM-dependent methyltransferase/glycosyltransferase involved in cell wall biosynthesis
MTRRANAPRLIEWTGERCVPWAPDVQVIYEHLHRYLWARTLVAGRDVLDLGSGEGFGAAILAEVASSVHGVDLDQQAVDHARLRYGDAAVSFAHGDATALDHALDGRFDVVVAFEVLEHVADQEGLLAGVRRVLRPGGLLVISTPNRLVYETTEGGNPFHVKELSDTEFEPLLAGHFANRRVFAQRVAEGSRIDAIDDPGPDRRTFRIERQGDEWAEVGPPPPYYMIALVSDAELPPEATGSTLLDHSLGLLRSSERHISERYGQALDDRDRTHAAREVVHAEVAARLKTALAQRDEAVEQAHAIGLETLEARDVTLGVEAQRDDALRRLDHISESISWRILQRAKREWRGPGAQPRLAARMISALLRFIWRMNAKRKTAITVPGVVKDLPHPKQAVPTALTVPTSLMPDVSIVIPVHSGAGLTDACLRAIVTATRDTPPYEVIVVDDCADTGTKALLAGIAGIRVVENEENLGYLRSVNRGVEHARGAVTVLLNNDTEPQPGWLAALLDRLASAAEIGAAGGRLIYPDGSLQEAGGIVFADGSAINYGNGDSPERAAYRFARPVDYCSAALLAIRTDLWRELGGFDEAYGPGYYEDVDLCFRLRELGHELWFEPRARVVHKEGGSHGTDTTIGVKRYQVINQQRFHARWRAELAHRPPTAVRDVDPANADRRTGPVVLIVDHIVPEPDRDAGSLRMIYLIRELIHQGARVVFMPNDRRATPVYSERIEAMGVEVLDHSIDLPVRLAELAERCKLIILSRPTIAAAVLPEFRRIFPGAKIMYDTVDLHWRREQARRAFEETPDGVVEAYYELELALVRSADMTAVVSTEEQQAILGEVPDADLRYVPVVQPIASPRRGRAGRDGLVLLGGYRHTPNTDAALFLAREVMPIVRARGLAITATLAGPDAPQEVTELAAPDIVVAGWIADAEALLDGALMMVAPLRYGAGMKGKVGQALARGLPVITTKVGAQGFGLIDGESALLAETPEEFADAIERLRDDFALWDSLAQAGPEVVRRTCSIETMATAVADLMAEVSPPVTA